MAVARSYGFEIHLMGNPISGSAAWFFVIVLKFIFKPIFELKIHEKISCHQKNSILTYRFDSQKQQIQKVEKEKLVIDRKIHFRQMKDYWAWSQRFEK